jgi:hypothetical protein
MPVYGGLLLCRHHALKAGCVLAPSQYWDADFRRVTATPAASFPS